MNPTEQNMTANAPPKTIHDAGLEGINKARKE
jgi:hypothetical protein